MVRPASGAAVMSVMPGMKPPAPTSRKTMPKMSAKVRVFMIQLPWFFVFYAYMNSYRNNGPVTSGVPARAQAAMAEAILSPPRTEGSIGLA